VICSRPLDNYPLTCTNSIEVARESLARIYAEPRLILARGEKALNVTINNCQLRHVGLTYLTFGAAAQIEFPETNYLSMLFPIRGRGRITNGMTTEHIGPERGLTINSAMSFEANYSDDYEHLVLRIEPATLLKKLAAIVGEPITGPIEFKSAPAAASSASQILRDYLFFLVGNLSTPAAPLPTWAIAESEQMLMVLFLHANKHNYSHLLDEQPTEIAHRQVRRAADYIEANWARPITLESLAAVTGACVRDLFRAFTRIRGCSPLEFVRQVRQRHEGHH